MLDCIWKLYLIFWGTSILFSVAAVPFYIPTFSTSSLWFIFVFKIIVSGILLFFVCHFPLWLVSVAFVAVLLTSLRWPVLKPACCGPHTQKGVCLVHWTVKGTLTEQCWGQGPCGWDSSSPGTSLLPEHLGASSKPVESTGCASVPAPALCTHILLSWLDIFLLTVVSPVYRELLENKNQDFYPCFSTTCFMVGGHQMCGVDKSIFFFCDSSNMFTILLKINTILFLLVKSSWRIYSTSTNGMTKEHATCH